MKTIVFVIYILIVGLISIILTAYDKKAAKKHRWRIPERSLLLLGLMGGAIPMYATMKLIRHKTKKVKFMIWLPLFAVLHIALGLLCYLL